MSMFEFSPEEHEEFSRYSPSYRKALMKEYQGNAERRQSQSDAESRADWYNENRGSIMGAEETGNTSPQGPAVPQEATGMYSEGISPLQRFMMEKNFSRLTSERPDVSEAGMANSKWIDQNLLNENTSNIKNRRDRRMAREKRDNDSPSIKKAKWLMGLNEEDRNLARSAWRGDKQLDIGTGFVNDRTKEFTGKELVNEQLKVAEGKDIASRLSEHPTMMKAMDSAADELDYSINAVSELHGLTGYDTVGFGKFLEHLPMTNTQEWIAMKDNIVARLGLEQLAKMKALSRTGASGLGQLSEKELKVLQEQLASLRQFQSPHAIKRGLKKIYTQLNKVKTSIRSDQQDNVNWYDRNSQNLRSENRYDNTKYYSDEKKNKVKFADWKAGKKGER